jgi:hypothetical protein
VLGLSQVTFAGGAATQSQDPVASSPEASKAAKSQTRSKKNRKKKTANISFIGYGIYAPQTVALPSAAASITPVVDPTVSPRQILTASKTPSIHISPIDDPPATVATAGQLVISEFRVRGPNGLNDEFIEIANVSGADHTVAALSGTGYGIAASDGTTRCSIPNGTVIPNKGHYLCVNSVGYSLASYPAGNGTTATGDATYTTDIPDNAGIALFNNNSGGGAYVLANRLDAVGSTSEANTLYKEGTGYPALVPFSNNNSF